MQDVYVDDCLSGAKSINKVKKLADDIAKVIARGGYTPKGFTISGQDPPPHLSCDGTSIAVAGMTWLPKEDLLSFDIKSLNFAKKYRGKTIGVVNEVPKVLTRRICTSKSAEVFDMTGLLTPITATLKLALHDLVKRKLSWDDPLPDNLRKLWITHFEMISEIKKYQIQPSCRAPERNKSGDRHTRLWRCQSITHLLHHLHSISNIRWILVPTHLFKITSCSRQSINATS